MFSLFLVFCAAAVGFSAWISSLGLAPFFLFPIVWMASPTRRCAYLSAAAYYLVASYGLVATAPVYFGLSTYSEIVRHLSIVWFGSSISLALPWCVLWGRNLRLASKALRLFLILAFLILPPLGLWGWGNPLWSAGYMFRGAREAGIIAVYLLWLALWHLAETRPRAFYALAFVALAYTVAPPVSYRATRAPEGWYGARTSFGMLMSGSGSVLSAYMRHHYLSGLISGTDAKYIVLPETVAGRWGDATEYLWAGITLGFQQSGRTYFVGAETEMPGSKKYYNVAQVRGANNMTVRQRFPVTYASWSPFGEDGAVSDWFGEGSGIVNVDDMKVGVLICFEPFIYLPPLMTMLNHPDVLVVCSNHWWCKDSYLPLLSDKIAASWALLFDVPLVLSKNM